MNEEDKKAFDQWYTENAFNYERDPIGSKTCGLQRQAWQAALEYARQPAEPVAYIHKDDLKELLSDNAGAHIRVGLDTRHPWPLGPGESDPYEWLVALYTHPAPAVAHPPADVVRELVEAAHLLLNSPAIADGDLTNPEFGCSETYEAVLKLRAALAKWGAA